MTDEEFENGLGSYEAHPIDSFLESNFTPEQITKLCVRIDYMSAVHVEHFVVRDELTEYDMQMIVEHGTIYDVSALLRCRKTIPHTVIEACIIRRRYFPKIVNLAYTHPSFTEVHKVAFHLRHGAV